jgi:hypothetical protein
MQKILFLCSVCLFLIYSSAQGQSWGDLLGKVENLEMIKSDEEWARTIRFLRTQYLSFFRGDSPGVATEKIRRIPIRDFGEKIVDISKKRNHRVEMLPTPLKEMMSPDYNAGFPHSGFVRDGVYRALSDMSCYLDELADIGGYERGSIIIKVFEGLRDLETQSWLFAKKVEEIRAKNASWSEHRLEEEASKWVSPIRNNIPVHSTGAAVDIRLWNEESETFLDMGPFGVIWGHNPTVPTFSEELNDKQKLNRLICIMAATRAGLVNYTNEFWHFSLGDRYAAYWTGESEAVYGVVSIRKRTSRTKSDRSYSIEPALEEMFSLHAAQGAPQSGAKKYKKQKPRMPKVPKYKIDLGKFRKKPS